ncbi:MAG: type II toxin-antitoxin system YoeB family toxin [Puniceicoccales bacterium]|jgi:toxin YoeB|nr:type II toxin-antitoxin system YoeB family toxin [Puniceicoccales bacterium]
MFEPKYSERFIKEYEKLCKWDKSAADKVDALVVGTLQHPMYGLGHPERLRHVGENIWSWRIDKKNRLVYKIVGNVTWFDSCGSYYEDC